MMAKIETPSDVIPGTIFTRRQVKILKVAVIVMGIILVAGFAFVVSAIVYQSSHLSESSAQPGPAAGYAGLTDLVVPDGMSISQLALGDNRLAVYLHGPASAEIRIIDLGTGKVINRIPVKSE